MAKKKYYVVWSGKKPGIYLSWDECKRQVMGVKGARYKSYPTEEEAKLAFQGEVTEKTRSNTQSKQGEAYIIESISVDAACSGNPGDMEYKGVYTENLKEIFHFGPVPNGTNNIGEFLAIVHALALLKKKSMNLPIYSDSATALAWVRKKKANTTIEKNESTEQLWGLIARAEQWLKSNTYSNPVLKWETKQWGESKADFGRK